MADWAGWWKYAREAVEQSADGAVTFTIGEVRTGARTFDQQITQRWWWNNLSNPDNTSNTGLLENGLTSEAYPETGSVEKVTLRLSN